MFWFVFNILLLYHLSAPQEVKDCKPTSVPFQHLPVNMERSGNADYLRFTRPLSPWTCLEGWHLGCCFHDPMHVLFLGTCRDLYGSALAYWLRNDCYGEGSMAAKLRQFSYDLKTQSRAAGFLGVCFNQILLICFDPSSSNRLDWCEIFFWLSSSIIGKYLFMIETKKISRITFPQVRKKQNNFLISWI